MQVSQPRFFLVPVGFETGRSFSSKSGFPVRFYLSEACQQSEETKAR
jgi:hypothetical protein